MKQYFTEVPSIGDTNEPTDLIYEELLQVARYINSKSDELIQQTNRCLQSNKETIIKLEEIEKELEDETVTSPTTH